LLVATFILYAQTSTVPLAICSNNVAGEALVNVILPNGDVFLSFIALLLPDGTYLADTNDNEFSSIKGTYTCLSATKASIKATAFDFSTGNIVFGLDEVEVNGLSYTGTTTLTEYSVTKSPITNGNSANPAFTVTGTLAGTRFNIATKNSQNGQGNF